MQFSATVVKLTNSKLNIPLGPIILAQMKKMKANLMQLWLQIYFQIVLIKSLLWNERKFRNSSLSPLYHTISGATVTISGTHYKNERINRAFHSSNFRLSVLIAERFSFIIT